ncbi:ABC transporter substrate-binding protein [Paenibacillus methanolicus]|uniref:Multiple sugar transport system substrate-binding protein n=1 Tax=Paenibacillus methanolicus TaxID=582686 RepID=A0A5S5CBE4_9BACL|nr:extracellular solute-binding protein [Paenibacillus methanolicus]TYP76674.1 multiple sugar transport system substrate-binding protein [Paenibacillus methanolicus]
MRNSKWGKRFGLGVTVIMLAGMLAACAGNTGGNDANNGGNGGDAKANAPKTEGANNGGTEAGGTTELSGEFVLWTWEPEHPTALAAFNEKYPGIKIKRVQVEAADVPQKLQTTIASGGELPDAIRIERGQKAKIFNMDILEDLEAEPYKADRSLLFDYDAPVFAMNDRLVAIPDDMSVAGLAYIKPLAKEYLGTDNPEEMEALLTDWDVFIEKGKEVLDKSGGKVMMFPSLGGVYDILKGQRDASYFDGNKLNVPQLQQVVTRLVQFRDAGIVDKLDQWTPAWNASFGGSKYLFTPSPVWMPQYVIGPNDKKPDRWALMVAPEGGYIRGGSSHGIPKGAKNAELAWKWIEFTSMTQAGAEAQKKDGVFTHFKEAYQDSEFSNWTWANFGSQDIGEKFFVDISAVTTDVAENVNDQVLDEAMNIVLQTLAKDKNFGAGEAMDRIQKELKAKAPDIAFE